MQSENNPRVKKVDISDTQKFTLSVTAYGITGSGESFGGYFHAGGVPARPGRPRSPALRPCPSHPRRCGTRPAACPVHPTFALFVFFACSPLLRTTLPQHCSHLFFCEKELLIVACLLATCFSALLSYLFDSLYFLSLSVLSVFRIVELFFFFASAYYPLVAVS
jgi:hypothetical protein